MSYIGRGLQSGAFRQLDSIASSFDGSTTGFTMQVNSTNVIMGDANQILLSLGGVIQNPGTDFTISSSTLTFTTAPATGTSFFAVLLGSDNGGTVTPTDGSVTGDKLASNIAITTSGDVSFDGGSFVFNESSADKDFRIESNGNTHMFFVDASSDAICIGQSNDIGKMVNITSGSSDGASIAMGSTIGGTGSAYGGHLNLFLGSQSNAGSGVADTQAGDHLGRISFNGQGTDYSYQGAEIDVVVQTGDGNDNRSNQGTAMVLKTMNVGSTGYAEHFRIAQDGTLTATDTSIGSNSDERLKENIQDYTYDIAKFKQFKPKTFDWKNPLEHDGKSNNRGFIAQEISAIDDYWIDQVDISMKQAEGNPAKDLDLIPAESNGMHLAYTSKLGKKDAMYISIIQQLITRIEALEDA